MLCSRDTGLDLAAERQQIRTATLVCMPPGNDHGKDCQKHWMAHSSHGSGSGALTGGSSVLAPAKGPWDGKWTAWISGRGREGPV